MMARRTRTRNAAQAAIVDMAHDLTGKYNLWEVWQDWIIMSATAIANVMGGPYATAREKEYTTRAHKYTPKELKILKKMFSQVVEGLTDNPDQDFLGDLYMSMELGDSWKGQFFTPYNLCRCVASMSLSDDFESKIRSKGWASVNDPACGAGALLVAFANECKLRGTNYQEDVLFVAQDLDHLAGMMCYIQLSLLGCSGYVVVGDTLAHPATSVDHRGLIPVDGPNVWYTPMYHADLWSGRRRCAAMDTMMQRPPAPEPLKDPEPPEEPEEGEDASGQLTFF